jgi:hypothetical protein
MKSNKIILTAACAALALLMGPSALAMGISAPLAQRQHPTKSSGSAPPRSAVPATASAVSKDKILLAAAEPFENLTEMAFSSSWSKIDHTIGEAKRLAAGARGSLPEGAAGSMDAHLTAMTAARQTEDRADLALSSIEVYRVLVSSVSAGTRIPTQVSLLDYSGFRYDADLNSSPIRWHDMNKVVTFGHQQWAVVAARVKDASLAKRFTDSLDGMDRAAQHKNTSLAASSAKSESDLVDELENYFSKH